MHLFSIFSALLVTSVRGLLIERRGFLNVGGGALVSSHTASFAVDNDTPKSAEGRGSPLEKRGACASGLFENFNQGMCTPIGDITDVAKPQGLSTAQEASMDNLMEKMKARQLQQDSIG